MPSVLKENRKSCEEVLQFWMSPKQNFDCPDCGQTGFRDNHNLTQHKKSCKGSQASNDAATARIVWADNVSSNFRPMERGRIQSQSLSKTFEKVEKESDAKITSLLRVSKSDFLGMFVAMFKLMWLDNEEPRHHHLLAGLMDVQADVCLVFKRGGWQFSTYSFEIRECLNEVAVRFYDVEHRIRHIITDACYEKFDCYREIIETISAAPTVLEAKLAEGISVSSVELDPKFRVLMEAVQGQLLKFTAARFELFKMAKAEALKHKPNISEAWLDNGRLYEAAKANYERYRDWLPGRPLNDECRKVIDVYKKSIGLAEDNIERAVTRYLSIDRSLYKAWMEK